MDKVILRAILSTLAAIGVLIALLALTCAFLFPSTLMTISYNLGMEKSAVRYAERAYKQDGGAYYLACAFEISVGEETYSDVEKFGRKLIQNKEFDEYCSRMDEEAAQTVTGSYAQYVYGNTYAAAYRNAKTPSEKQQAIDEAFACVNSGFPRNNAVFKMVIVVLRSQDATATEYTLEKMLALQTEKASAFSESDQGLLQEMITLVQGYMQ